MKKNQAVVETTIDNVVDMLVRGTEDDSDPLEVKLQYVLQHFFGGELFEFSSAVADVLSDPCCSECKFCGTCGTPRAKAEAWADRWLTIEKVVKKYKH